MKMAVTRVKAVDGQSVIRGEIRKNMSNIVVPFLNLFNGYTCPICKKGVEEGVELCQGCNSEINWSKVDKPDYDKKYNAVNHCPEIHD